MKITVQMCSYNRKELLRRALEALFQVDFPSEEYEVVLVDDGSTDGTGEMIQTLQPPCRLKYCRQEKSGLATGRNLGIRNAEGDVILFIDDDTLAHPALLKEHWEVHERNPRCVVMGWVNHTDNLDRKLSPRFRLADLSTSFFWTSNASVRRRYLEEAGLFDEEFTEYGWEDIEMGHRLRDLRLVRKYNPRAIVYHYKTRWKAADLPRLYRQAQSSGRSAVIYVGKRPELSARLSTGVFPLRFIWNDILRVGERLYEKTVRYAGDRPLSGLPLLSARLLISFRYFDAVRTSLSALSKPDVSSTGDRP